MGVYINTYRCRVGMFVPGGSCGFLSLFITFGRVVKLLGSLTLARLLLFMAGVEQNPGPADKKYIFRYQYLLVQIGTDVMRKIFDVRVGNDFSAYLAANKKARKKLQSLILAKIITADQTKHLPPIDMSPVSTNFDITLLACLLRNVCGLRGHSDPVWKNPQPTDFSLEADLARLKECRNNLQHSGSVFILETDLTDKWKELSQILIRLNTICGIPNLSLLIEDAEKKDIDEELKERHDQDIKAWNDIETLIDHGIEEIKFVQTEIKEGQSDMKGDIVQIKEGQSDMKGDLIEIKEGQSDIKGELEEIKEGQSDIKGDIEEIKEGQSDMKGDIVEIKEGQSDIKVDIEEIKESQSDMKGDIIEIKQGQSDMKGDIIEIKEGQSDMKGDIEEVKEGQSDMKGDIIEIQEGQSDMKGDIEEIKEGQSDMKGDIVEIKEGQSDIKGDIVEIKEGQSDIKGDIVETKEGQSAIKGDIVEIKEGQSDMKGDIEEIKEGQSDMKGDIEEIKEGQSDMKGDIEEIKEGQSDMKGDIEEIKEGQSDMKGDIVKLKEGQSDMKGDIVETKEGQSAIKGDIVEIKEGQYDIKGDIVEIKECQSDTKGDFIEIKEGLSDIKGGIVEIKDGQQDTKRQIEQIEKTHCELKPDQLDMDESDLRNRLVKIYEEECCTLPVSPLCGEDQDKMELLTIYQRPNMCRKPYHRSQEEEENYPISSYKNIFFKDDKPFRNIYVTGDAGVGKTSFCQCMAFLWCKCGVNIGNDNLQKDIDFMTMFDFVFYISLRDSVHEDVLDMIIEQYFYTTPKQEEISKKMLKDVLRQRKCLIILDALDEWSPQRNENKKRELPRKFPSDKCTYLTTCRPYKVENVRLSREDLDIEIQMMGITKNSTKCFVKEIVNHINDKTKDNKNPDDFISDIQKCGLQEQIHIPMIAAHMVAVWFDHKLTDMSRALIYSNVVNMLFKKAEKRKIEFPQPAACTVPLPGLLTKLVYFKKYFSLLEKMCLLSFRSLFKQDECVSVLVFTEEHLMSEPYFLSMEEINFFCKIGILSKNKVIALFGKQEHKLSFLHKSYLEFFASLFVSSFDSNHAFDDVIKKWKSINDVVQYSVFFRLLAGFSCHRTELLFKNIFCTISDDLRLCRRNAIFHYDFGTYSEQIKSLQNMVINCLKELCRSNDANVSFKLEDFIFGRNLLFDDYDIESDVDDAVALLKNNLRLNRKCVKSIRSVYGEYLDEFDEIKNLQYLNVGKVLSADYKKFTQLMLWNKSTLHTVCILGDTVEKSLIPELPVSSWLPSVLWSIIGRQSLQHLTSLSLSHVKMKHNSLHNLVNFLSANDLIENIKLYSVYCDNHQDDDSACIWTLNLPHHTKLASLCLAYVNILCKNVNNSSLKSITLGPFSEMIVRPCFDVFNPVRDSQFECLRITSVEWLDNNALRTLIHTVITFPCIKYLELLHMKLPDDALLQLHPHVTQVEIWLHDVTMSCQCFHYFIASFVNNKTVIKVQLSGCKITSVKTHRELSDQESWDYMYEYLSSIPTVKFTYKSPYRVEFETTICV